MTGGTGFFGKTLLGAIRQNGIAAAEWVLLSRDPEKFLRGNPEFSDLPGVAFVTGDVRSFKFPSGRFDAVIHAATPASASMIAEQPEEMYSIITEGTARVAEFAGLSGAEKILFTSSGAVYGEQPPELDRIPETAPCAPVTVYGKGKLEAEHLLAACGIPAVIARCFAFIGEYLPLDIHFAAGNFIGDALAGRRITVKGDGRTVRSYLYSGDLVRWLWKILTDGVPGRVYNVGSPDAVTVRELAELCADIGGTGVEVLGKPGDGPAPRYVPDVSRARSELGLSPRTPLRQAVETVMNFHRETRASGKRPVIGV